MLLSPQLSPSHSSIPPQAYEKKERENNGFKKARQSTKYSVGCSHGSFKVESTHILPSLLHQRYQEVDSHRDVLSKVLLSEVDVTNSSTQTGCLL